MWKQLVSSLLVSGLVIAPAFADHRGKGGEQSQERFDFSRVAYARVVDVQPIMRTVRRQVPERECWQEQVRYEQPGSRHGSATPVILGGIIGAAIGNSLGNKHHKTNRDLKTFAGGLIGASIGSDIARRDAQRGAGHVGYRSEQRCEVSYHTELDEKLIGYDVTYRYQGETYRTRMDYDPGKKLKVNVQVRPVM